jgi:nucleoid-associated protein YgaU
MPVHLGQGGSRPGAAIGLASASLVVAAAMGSIFLRAALDAWAATASPGPAGPADGILLITGLGGALLALWLGLGVALSALSALPGALGNLCRRLAGRVAPVAVRKVVAFLLGTTLTAALIPGTAVAGIGHGRPEAAVTAQQVRYTSSGGLVAAPDASFRLVSGQGVPGIQAHAAVPAASAIGGVQDVAADLAVSAVSAVSAVAASEDAAPAPSWSPQRGTLPHVPQSTARGLRPALAAGTSPVSETVVVLRGDTLWSIAARHLGPAASAADIEIEWHRWLATNRAVIGDDADLILPGQLLRPPATRGSGS